MRVRHEPPDAAAEWLRLQVIEGRVRAVFTRSVQASDPRNLQLLGQWTNRRAGDEGHHSLWISPSDDFEAGTQVMEEHRVVHGTRYFADDLRAALEAETLTNPETAKEGRPPEWPWAEIVATVSFDYALENGAMDAETMTALVQDAAEKRHAHGRRPSRTTAQGYAGMIRKVWSERRPAR